MKKLVLLLFLAPLLAAQVQIGKNVQIMVQPGPPGPSGDCGNEGEGACIVGSPTGDQLISQLPGTSFNANTANKVFYVAGFPQSATLDFGDGCLLADGTSCSGTFESQLDVANATAAEWIYHNAQQWPGGNLTVNMVACHQASAKLQLANDSYFAYHPVCGPNNIPNVTVNQVTTKPSLSISGVGKGGKTLLKAGATMEAVIYCNDSTLAMNASFDNFSVDGGYHGLDTNSTAVTGVTVSGGIATYNGSFPTGASGALVGYKYDFSGMTNAGNNQNGLIVTASTTTTLTVANPSGVTETGSSGHAVVEMANWAIELNGLVNTFIDHVDGIASGAVGIEALGIGNEDAAFFIKDQFLYGIHPIPFSTVAQGVANMVDDGGGNFHVGSLTLNAGGNFYCSLTTTNCAVQVRFVGAGTKKCSALPTATGTAAGRVVTGLTLTSGGTNCGTDIGISIEPVSTAQYMFYGSDWVNSTAYDVNVTGVTSTATRSAGFTIAAGGNHIIHGHPQDTAIGYLDDGGVSYDHPECDTITDHCFDLNGDGDTITGMSSYWQAGTSYLPFSYDFFLGSTGTNTGILSKVCRIGGQSYGGYYEFVDSNGPDDFAVNAPVGLTVLNNQYCGPITQTGTLNSTTTVAVANTAGLRVNYPITAPTGIVPGTIITAITPNTSITLSQAATSISSQPITMASPLPRTFVGTSYANQISVGSPASAIVQTSPGNFGFINSQTGLPGHALLSGISMRDPSTSFITFFATDPLTANRSLTIPNGSGKFVLTGVSNGFAAGVTQQFTSNTTTFGFELTPQSTVPTSIVQGGLMFNGSTGRVVAADTGSTTKPLAYTTDFNGITASGAGCTITAITNGLITGGTC